MCDASRAKRFFKYQEILGTKNIGDHQPQPTPVHPNLLHSEDSHFAQYNLIVSVFRKLQAVQL